MTELELTNISKIESSDFSFRSQPSNIEAEQALLGAILVNNEIASLISNIIESSHFFEPIHSKIFDTINKLIDKGQLANPTTIKSFFENDETLAEIGANNYLNRLADGAITIINATDYANVIRDLSIKRSLINIGEEMVNSAFEIKPEEDSIQQIEVAEQKLYQLAEKGRNEGGFNSFSSALTKAIENAEAAKRRDGHLSGISSGFKDLDKKLGGFQSSDLIILAGRPSMGKTALATNIAYNTASLLQKDLIDGKELSEGTGVAFFSLEMSAEQLATRILAEVTNIPSERLRKGNVSNDDFDNLVLSSQQLENMPFFIDDTPAINISTLRARARRLKRQENIGLIIIDYLQLIRPAYSSRTETRVIEISEITQGLKALAKELNVPILALSQLSRQVEQRDDKRPQLSDLRESGAIEQDADLVMFIYREEYYHGRKKPNEMNEQLVEWEKRMEEIQGITEVIIGKYRHGPTGTITLLFNGEVTKFADLALKERTPEIY
ncbi:MAG: replicative DNA helicase [Rhodospirillaceae bacterium]|nr:replicative DNA helicase [Rhodospirillaceae bacterium]|tara:strand:+ start:476 stop:1966 length:1491 start_codon:yes stop_codon:yes gene_type:complete